MSTCRCSHPADTHLHFRAGTDCGECGTARCGAYVPADLTDDQALTYLALAPFALASDHIAEDPVTAPDPRTFTTDDGDEYERIDPAELPDFDDVNALAADGRDGPAEDPADGEGEH